MRPLGVVLVLRFGIPQEGGDEHPNAPLRTPQEIADRPARQFSGVMRITALRAQVAQQALRPDGSPCEQHTVVVAHDPEACASFILD